MKLTEAEKKNAWCMFAAGALAGLANLSGDTEIKDECGIASEYADWMLENFVETFGDEDDE